LQIVDLLLLACRVAFAINAVDLLVGLQALQLLVVSLLIELLLGLSCLGLLGLQGLGFLLFDFVQLLLRSIDLLVALESFELLSRFDFFGFLFLASFSLFS